MHVCAVHIVPPTHDGVFVQPISHASCPHETLPLHAPEPVQHSVLVCAALVTTPEHDGDPAHVTSHFVVALHVTLLLHAWSPHEIAQSWPLHVTLPLHAAVSHAMLHFCAVHVMSLAHDR